MGKRRTMEDGESVRARLRRRVYSLDIASIQATNTGVLVAAAKHVEDTRSRQASVFAREAEIRDGHALSAIDSIDDRLQDLDQTLQDGFNGLGHMLLDQFEQTQEMLEGLQARVDELIKVGKTPTKTHAFEQFDEARKAMEHGWYTEALRFLDGALNGVPNVSAGYKVEWRFYALLGKILLALSKQEDLVAAEAAFLCVVRYAEPESKEVAAEAAGQAAWVAYALKKPSVAHAHMQRSVEIGGIGNEERWALAKFAAAAGMAEEAEQELDALVAKRPQYLETAERDPDFQVYLRSIIYRVERNQKAREQKVKLPQVLEKMRVELQQCDVALKTMPEVAAHQEILVGWRTILDGPTPSHTVADALEIRFERESEVTQKARRNGNERIIQEQRARDVAQREVDRKVREETERQALAKQQEQQRLHAEQSAKQEEEYAAREQTRIQTRLAEKKKRAEDERQKRAEDERHERFEVPECPRCRQERIKERLPLILIASMLLMLFGFAISVNDYPSRYGTFVIGKYVNFYVLLPTMIVCLVAPFVCWFKTIRYTPQH